MNIPKHLQRPGMSQERKTRLEKFVAAAREVVSKEPTFPTKPAAVSEAVKQAKANKLNLPSVWKEPADIGKKFAVVKHENREEAYNGGYTEVADTQEIVDRALGRIDDIEEV